MTANANVNPSGGAFTTPDEEARIPAYTLVNGSIEWLSRSEKFNVRL